MFWKKISDETRAQAALYLFEYAARLKDVDVDELLTRLNGEQIAALPLGAESSDRRVTIERLANERSRA